MASVTRKESAATFEESIDPSWKLLVRIGGMAALLAAALWIVATALVFVTTPPTSGGAQTLEYIAAHRSLYIFKQVLWLAPLGMTMVMFLAFYPVLERFARSLALLSVVLGIAAWGISLAWPTTGEGAPALVVLSDNYMATTNPALRAPFVAAAEGLIATNATPAAPGILETISVLVVSLAMLGGGVPRGLAYLGIVTGALGVVGEALRSMLGSAYALYGILLLAWLVAVGWTLLRAARNATPADANSRPRAQTASRSPNTP